MFALAAPACRRTPPAAEALLPAGMPGGWRRREVHEMPAESMPLDSARSSVRRVFQANYEGPASIQVDLFDLASSAAGLDLAQRWRPTPDTVFFYKENYFAVVKWQSFDRQHLTAFVRGLEQHLGKFAAGR